MNRRERERLEAAITNYLPEPYRAEVLALLDVAKERDEALRRAVVDRQFAEKWEERNRVLLQRVADAEKASVELKSAAKDMRALYMRIEESEFGSVEWSEEELAEIDRALDLSSEEVCARIATLLGGAT